ncbi:hypothetical protein AVEN_7061-1 [Araneus ventricosus]|uniref:Uncharacterized protein n=1 Tax=Araneus ventricosus TaxID=182803 RepID=A0A4Y2RK28_ARAVE|nr:hypothetical protein AVEN_7061-1 [Araneus ventricosus]
MFGNAPVWKCACAEMRLCASDTEPPKQDPLPVSPRQLHSLFPFCGFRFCGTAPLSFSRIVFRFYDRMRQMENERCWISKLFDHNSSILIGYSH